MSDQHQHVTGAEHQTPGNQTTERPAALEPEQAPALFSAKWPWPEVTPAALADLYRVAGAMITVRGYNAYERDNYDGAVGISIGGALRMAAEGYLLGQAKAQGTDGTEVRRTIERDTADLTEDLETRLAAVLYVLGQQHYRTGIQDLADRVAAWELGHDDISRHVDAPMALALLEHAAGIYDVIGATDGAERVTIAPAPEGR